MQSNTTPRLILIAAITTLLAACGGGGGSTSPAADSGNTNTTPPVNQGSSYSQAITSVDAITGTGQMQADHTQAYAYINAQRQASGLGLMRFVSTLQTSAQGHANYSSLNSSVTHSQNSSLPGYTGATVTSRISAAGYSPVAAIEAIAPGAPSVQTLSQLMSAPYHRIALLSHQYTDMGLGYATSNTYEFRTVLHASRTGSMQDMQTSTALTTYPYDGQTGVQTAMANETPDPYAELGAWCAPNCPGYTISVQSRKLTNISAATFVVTDGNGQTVTGKTLTSATDSTMATNQWNNWAFFIPSAPLTAATTYTVQAQITIDGQVSTKTWNFTTKANTYTATSRVYGNTVIVDIDSPSGLSKSRTQQLQTPNNCTGGFDYRSSTTTTGAIYTIVTAGGSSCALNVFLTDAANSQSITHSAAMQ